MKSIRDIYFVLAFLSWLAAGVGCAIAIWTGQPDGMISGRPVGTLLAVVSGMFGSGIFPFMLAEMMFSDKERQSSAAQRCHAQEFERSATP